MGLIWLAHICMNRTIEKGLEYAVGFNKSTIQKFK
ncbi:MAG: hypothetical protein ACTHY0_10580 [Mammaliicoccus vitulinus]